MGHLSFGQFDRRELRSDAREGFSRCMMIVRYIIVPKESTQMRIRFLLQACAVTLALALGAAPGFAQKKKADAKTAQGDTAKKSTPAASAVSDS